MKQKQKKTLNIRFIPQRSKLARQAFSLLFLLCAISVSTLGVYSYPEIPVARAGITKLINFQGKLTLTSGGTNVADGNYSFQFKIYDALTSGNLLWTETWDGGTSQVAVTNGVFSVKLGTHVSLDAVDFATKTPYLSVNFNPGAGYDGEMSPRKQLAATAFAYNANNLVGDGRIDITYAPGNSTNPGASITYNPSVSSSNNALTVSANSNVTGPALKIVQAGTGGSVLIGSTALGGATQTYIGANPAAFSGNFLDFQVGSSSRFKVDNTGAVTAAGAITGPTSTNTINGLVINSGVLSNISSISLNQVTNGNGFTHPASHSVTSGKVIDISGNGSPGNNAFTGAYISVDVDRAVGFSALNDSGNYLKIDRTPNFNTTGTYTISGDLVALSGNCTTSGGGTCVDTSSILSVTQSFASASGASLKISTAGTGFAIDLQGAGGSARTINSTSAALVLKTTTSGNITLDPQTGIVAGTAALTLRSGGTSNLTIDSNSTGALNLGTGNNAKTISIGTGNAGNAINIGTNNTVSDTITIGSALDNVSIVGDQWSITDAGVLTVASCTGCGGSGSQTPWLQDIDADNFSLLDFGANLTARAGLTIASSGAGGLTFNSASGAITSNATTLTLGGSATLNGGTGSGGTLTLVSTTNGTKGDIQFFSSSNKITSAGALTLASTITAATSGTINGLSINSGAVSGVTTLSAAGAIAANGGITFDNATDTLGAHTLAGTTDANANIITNIGNSGTDFIASTGALTLAGVLTANGGISVGSQALTGTTGVIDYTNFDIDASGNADIGGAITVGSANTVLTLSTGKIDADALTLTAAADGGTGTSSGSGLIARSDGIGLLQGCSDGQILKWVESTDTWDCAADSSGGGGTTTTITKSANQAATQSSTTMQNDNTLVFAVATNKTYIIEAYIPVDTSNATADLKYTVTVPASTTLNIFANSYSTTSAVITCNIIASAQACSTTVNSAINFIHLRGFVATAGTAGNFQFQFAQNTSAAASFPVVKKGATLYYTPTSGADLAETYYTNDLSMEAGDVVSLDPDIQAGVKKSQTAYSHDLLGIISTRPGLLIGDEGGGGMPVPVALAGRVPVKVTAENGPINPGDFLTSSSVPGVAMKSNKAGIIIGQAMTSFSGEGVGQVLVFINNSFSLGSKVSDLLPEGLSPSDNTLARATLSYFMEKQRESAVLVDVSEIVTDRLSAGLEIITPRLLADGLEVNSITGLEGTIDLKTDTIFFGRPYFNTDTGGFAMISKGKKHVNVVFDKEYLEQPIIAANVTLEEDARLAQSEDPVQLQAVIDQQEQVIQEIFDSGLQYFVVNKTTRGFMIVINKPAVQDLRFSWLAIAVKGAKVFTLSDEHEPDPATEDMETEETELVPADDQNQNTTVTEEPQSGEEGDLETDLEQDSPSDVEGDEEISDPAVESD